MAGYAPAEEIEVCECEYDDCQGSEAIVTVTLLKNDDGSPTILEYLLCRECFYHFPIHDDSHPRPPEPCDGGDQCQHFSGMPHTYNIDAPGIEGAI